MHNHFVGFVMRRLISVFLGLHDDILKESFLSHFCWWLYAGNFSYFIHPRLEYSSMGFSCSGYYVGKCKTVYHVYLRGLRETLRTTVKLLKIAVIIKLEQ